jgi:hypothetical protein
MNPQVKQEGSRFILSFIPVGEWNWTNTTVCFSRYILVAWSSFWSFKFLCYYFYYLCHRSKYKFIEYKYAFLIAHHNLQVIKHYCFYTKNILPIKWRTLNLRYLDQFSHTLGWNIRLLLLIPNKRQRPLTLDINTLNINEYYRTCLLILYLSKPQVKFVLIIHIRH